MAKLLGKSKGYSGLKLPPSSVVSFQATLYKTISQDLAEAGETNRILIGPALVQLLHEQFCGVTLEELHAKHCTKHCFVISADFKVKRNCTSDIIADLRLLVPKGGETEDVKVLASAKSLACGSKVDAEFVAPRATPPTGDGEGGYARGGRPDGIMLHPDLIMRSDLYDGGTGELNCALFRAVTPALFVKGDTVHVVELGLSTGDELDSSHAFWSESGFDESGELQAGGTSKGDEAQEPKAEAEYWVVLRPEVTSLLRAHEWTLRMVHGVDSVLHLRKAGSTKERRWGYGSGSDSDGEEGAHAFEKQLMRGALRGTYPIVTTKLKAHLESLYHLELADSYRSERPPHRTTWLARASR